MINEVLDVLAALAKDGMTMIVVTNHLSHGMRSQTLSGAPARRSIVTIGCVI